MREYTRTAATLSNCDRFRFTLFREWGEHDARLPRKTFVVIGLNPSTADATKDDATIRRCVNFAEREGCNRLVMLNIFAFRATDPRVMYAAIEPEEMRLNNNRYIRIEVMAALQAGGKVVAAWGTHGAHKNRGRDIAKIVLEGLPLLCFGTTKDGHPKHPLYLPVSAPLVPFNA